MAFHLFMLAALILPRGIWLVFPFWNTGFVGAVAASGVWPGSCVPCSARLGDGGHVAAVRAQEGAMPAHGVWVAYFAQGPIFKDNSLGVLIVYFILKIILKERQERKQQRLQENAVSPAPAGDAVLDGDSGGDDEPLEQADPSGTERSCLLGVLGEPCSRGGRVRIGGVRLAPGPAP